MINKISCYIKVNVCILLPYNEFRKTTSENTIIKNDFGENVFVWGPRYNNAKQE